jgi:hypothetical protein
LAPGAYSPWVSDSNGCYASLPAAAIGQAAGIYPVLGDIYLVINFLYKAITVSSVTPYPPTCSTDMGQIGVTASGGGGTGVFQFSVWF